MEKTNIKRRNNSITFTQDFHHKFGNWKCAKCQHFAFVFDISVQNSHCTAHMTTEQNMFLVGKKFDKRNHVFQSCTNSKIRNVLELGVILELTAARRALSVSSAAVGLLVV